MPWRIVVPSLTVILAVALFAGCGDAELEPERVVPANGPNQIELGPLAAGRDGTSDGSGWRVTTSADSCQSFGAGSFGYSGELESTEDGEQNVRVEVTFESDGLTAGTGSVDVALSAGAASEFEVNSPAAGPDSDNVSCTVLVTEDPS